jgi:hypothetical protein
MTSGPWRSVRHFARGLADRDRPALLVELTKHAISAWLAESAATAEPCTVATRLRGMRRFCPRAGHRGRTGRRPERRHRDPRATGEAGADPDRRPDRRRAHDLRGLPRSARTFDRSVFLDRRDEVVLRLSAAPITSSPSISTSRGLTPPGDERTGSDGTYRPASRLFGTTGPARDLRADPVPRRRLTRADGQLEVSRVRRRAAEVDAYPGRNGRLGSGWSVTALATGSVRPRRERGGTSGRRRAGPEPELPEPR